MTSHCLSSNSNSKSFSFLKNLRNSLKEENCHICGDLVWYITLREQLMNQMHNSNSYEWFCSLMLYTYCKKKKKTGDKLESGFTMLNCTDNALYV